MCPHPDRTVMKSLSLPPSLPLPQPPSPLVTKPTYVAVLGYFLGNQLSVTRSLNGQERDTGRGYILRYGQRAEEVVTSGGHEELIGRD